MPEIEVRFKFKQKLFEEFYLLPLHVLDGVVPDLLEQLGKPVDLSFHPGDLLQLLRLLILPLARLLLGKHVLGQLGKVLAFRLKQALSPLLVLGVELLEIVSK